MTGPGGSVYLYVGLVGGADAGVTERAYEAVLTADERACRDRFVFERDRRAYLFAHGLVRHALSRHAPGIAPDAWRFAAGPYGRPEVAGPANAPALPFNLTHTEGLVACVVADARAAAGGVAVGVDAETVDRPVAIELADHYFAPPEVRALRALPPARQRDRFFEYWTLKEAYLKARGLGLSCPLDRFWFVLGTSGIEMASTLDDPPARWRFTQYRPTASHVVSVAIGAGDRGAPACVAAAASFTPAGDHLNGLSPVANSTVLKMIRSPKISSS